MMQRLHEECKRVNESRDHLVAIPVMTWLAFAYTQAAWLLLAHQQCLDALALIEQMGSRTAAAGYLQYYLFNVYECWSRLEEAANSLYSLRRIAQDWHQVELLSLGERALVQLALARGDLATAHQALQKVEMLLEQEEFAGHARWVTALRVGYWLAEANLAEASNWAAQTMFSPKSWNPLRKREVLMLVRVFLAQQKYP